MQNVVCNAQIINSIWFVWFCVPLEKGQNGVFWEADFGCLLMADRSFFVTISQRTRFVLFLGRYRFASPQHPYNFNERVSLIIPLLFSLRALVFDFDRRTKEHLSLAYAHTKLMYLCLVSFLLRLLALLYVMLKFAVKREQSQACLSYARREQIEQS